MTRDIKPVTRAATPRRDFTDAERQRRFPFELVTALVGMSPTFVRRVIGRGGDLSLEDVQLLLDQDAYAETFVPRSKIIEYLLNRREVTEPQIDLNQVHQIIQGNALELIGCLPDHSIQCVVTSTPYWGMRLYDTHFEVAWADGEVCAFGNEQTPEAFVRHTTELLYVLKPKMELDGSVWWNLMDTYNTRTQIRENAAETLQAMQGLDARGWHDHAARRYSAGHSFLEDGEQCMIPSRVAERASRIGYLLKSQIFWKKDVSMPETVRTRVTREAEHILHLTLQRSPYFDKGAFRTLPQRLGGRNPLKESDKITDIWCLPTAMGQDGHGAQFPLELPGRCIGLTSEPGDLILDPFVGSGSTSVAALQLDRLSLGFDISGEYVDIARTRLEQTRVQHAIAPLMERPVQPHPHAEGTEQQQQPQLLF
ncbi:DNA-methyltransferase [Deinococcus sp. A31D244]|uniref:DNA-methyltransferase n=1 Tax=Deinococcus sp. A31D244 TaxID=3397675 RepID=UPI0039E161EB